VKRPRTTPKTRRRNQARKQFWRDIVAAWQQSGQSVRAFCAARGVKDATFFARRRELFDRKPTCIRLLSVWVPPTGNEAKF
jgi:hypothetical protein